MHRMEPLGGWSMKECLDAKLQRKKPRAFEQIGGHTCATLALTSSAATVCVPKNINN